MSEAVTTDVTMVPIVSAMLTVELEVVGRELDTATADVVAGHSDCAVLRVEVVT